MSCSTFEFSTQYTDVNSKAAAMQQQIGKECLSDRPVVPAAWAVTAEAAAADAALLPATWKVQAVGNCAVRRLQHNLLHPGAWPVNIKVTALCNHTAKQPCSDGNSPLQPSAATKSPRLFAEPHWLYKCTHSRCRTSIKLCYHMCSSRF